MNTFQPEIEVGWPLFKTNEQLCALVLDGSGSMAATESASGLPKAVRVQQAVVELLNRLRSSGTAEQFSLAAITFDHRVACPLPPTPVSDLVEGDLTLNLLANHGGQTAIGDALDQAGKEIEQFFHEEEDAIPRYAIVLLMSDGQNSSGEDPLVVAQRLKARFNQTKPHGHALVIAVAAYGDDADSRTLKQIASGEQFYRRVENGAELRDFFFSSITRSLAGDAVAA